MDLNPAVYRRDFAVRKRVLYFEGGSKLLHKKKKRISKFFVSWCSSAGLVVLRCLLG